MLKYHCEIEVPQQSVRKLCQSRLEKNLKPRTRRYPDTELYKHVTECVLTAAQVHLGKGDKDDIIKIIKRILLKGIKTMQETIIT